MADDAKERGAAPPLDIEKLAAVLDQLPSGVMVAEAPSGRVLYANEQAERIFGGPLTTPDRPVDRAESYGVVFQAWDGEGRPLASEHFPLVKALSGEVVDGQVVTFQRPDGALRTVRASAAPVRDSGGAVVAAVTAYYDVTEAKRAQDDLAFLVAASDLLASSLDFQTTLDRVAALPVPSRADWCFVDLLDTDGGFVRVAVGSHTQQDAELAQRLRRRYPPRPGVRHGVARALRGEHHISGTVDDTMLSELARDAEHLTLLRALRMRSFLSVPLYARGRPIGALTLASHTRSYDDGDLRLAVELGRRAAAAIESARLYAETEARAVEQARWERLFRHSGWGVALIAPDFVLREVNPAWAAMHGYTVEELQGRPLSMLLTAPERDKLAERGRRADEGEHLEFQSIHQRKDGSAFPVLMDVISVRDESGGVQYRAANCQDISERTRTEHAMRTSEARLQAFIDSSSSVFYLKDLEGRHVLANREYERLTGLRREELLGKTDYDLVDRATAEAFRADDRQVLATAAPLQIAHSFVYDGQRRSFLTTKFPVRDGRGQVYGVGGISTDVTEQHRLEAELRASERRFRTLAQATTDIVWTIDGSGRGFRDSAGWRAFTGQSEALAASSRSSEAVHPDDRAHVRETWQAAIVEKRPFAMEYRLRRHDGVYVPMMVRGAPVLDDDGRVREWVGSCTDISSAKQLEAERTHALERAEAARAEAERSARAKDEFLAMLGHELRNPLAPIVTALEIIKQRQPATTREHEVIERQVQHVVRLVDDLLDVSRITRGKIDLKREPLELAQVVAKGVEIASPLYEERRHRLEVDVAPSGLTVEGDATRLAQVVANLLTNAAKYTPPGGRIALSAVRDGGELVLRVKDDGIGISAELLPRVFDLFVQGDRPVDRAEGGLGLGLALVRSLLQLHGGSVTAASEGPERGSEFVVRLPAVDGQRAVERVPAGPRAARSVTARRVLVVDDNEDAADMLAEMLRSDGHVTRVAYDGPTALQLVADGFRPELAILDIGLPVMDGYELAARLRQSLADAAPKMVALTGYGQEHDRARSARAGFALHLVKPVVPERLLAYVGAS